MKVVGFCLSRDPVVGGPEVVARRNRHAAALSELQSKELLRSALDPGRLSDGVVDCGVKDGYPGRLRSTLFGLEQVRLRCDARFNFIANSPSNDALDSVRFDHLPLRCDGQELTRVKQCVRSRSF